jgi:hypothetical protein
MTPHIPWSSFVIMGNTMPPQILMRTKTMKTMKTMKTKRKRTAPKNAGRARAGRRLEHVRWSALVYFLRCPRCLVGSDRQRSLALCNQCDCDVGPLIMQNAHRWL